jgi:3',5'-cyclic AMP phosphodiesterase CpdA
MPASKRPVVSLIGVAFLLVGAAQSPAPPADAYTFLHVSDLHLSEATLPRLERVRQIVAERKPAFVLITGDLVRDALRVGEAEARGYFELYKKTIATFPSPVHSTLGNHDIFGIERDASRVSVDHPLYGKKMFRHYLGPDYYSFDHGRIHFVVLDTVDVEDTKYYGHVDAGQLAWLDRDLSALPAGATVVAVTHIPLVTGAIAAWGYREGMGAGDTVVEIGGKKVFRHVVSNTAQVLGHFAHVRLPLVLAGHTHGAERLSFELQGPRIRFNQAASVAPPFENDPIRMVSGVTLYRVSGTEVDDGEFIPLDRR